MDVNFCEQSKEWSTITNNCNKNVMLRNKNAILPSYKIILQKYVVDTLAYICFNGFCTKRFFDGTGKTQNIA